MYGVFIWSQESRHLLWVQGPFILLGTGHRSILGFLAYEAAGQG